MVCETGGVTGKIAVVGRNVFGGCSGMFNAHPSRDLVRPQPLQGRRQLVTTPYPAVPSFGHHQLMLISRKSEGSRHVLVRQRPVAEQVIEVVFPFLQVNLDRFGMVLALAYPGRIDGAARMLVKLPMWLRTLPKRSGRSQATVKAQIPPEEIPATARWAGSAEIFKPSKATGRNSSVRKRA